MDMTSIAQRIARLLQGNAQQQDAAAMLAKNSAALQIASHVPNRIGPGRRSVFSRSMQDNSKYKGHHLRKIRALKGVGRPPKVTQAKIEAEAKLEREIAEALIQYNSVKLTADDLGMPIAKVRRVAKELQRQARLRQVEGNWYGA